MSGRCRLAGAAVAVVLAAPVPALAAPGAGAERLVRLGVDAAIERVDDDLLRPFIPPEPGDVVLVRVRVRNAGPAVARRGEIGLVVNGSAAVTIRGNSGWRCTRSPRDLGTLNCISTRVLRPDAVASLLVRMPARGVRARIFARAGASRAAPEALRVVSDSDRAAIRLDVPRWTGTWSWQAVLRGGSGRAFTAPSPMRMAQEGTTVCAVWDFSGGGRAVGTLSGDVWTARFQDGYGTGAWSLTLDGDAATGGQSLATAQGGRVETYDITARQIGEEPPALRCADVVVP